jgi:YHS domain-containing protein
MKTIPTILLICLGLASCGKTSNAGSYPLTTCVVSGEKLDSMGDPHVFTHEGTEVRLCCESCLDDFNKEPAKYMAKLKP